MFGFTWKILLFPPLVHIWLIMNNWWTTVLWSGSTKLCSRFRKHFRLLALKYFFGLHIKSLVNLNFRCNFRNWGGGNCPHCHPLATRLEVGLNSSVRKLHNFNVKPPCTKAKPPIEDFWARVLDEDTTGLDALVERLRNKVPACNVASAFDYC